ncbi:hypothetical protein [Streptomyces wuyuanensis]|uniref:hypothetical protein n=1 Tax=Streptomyces wuyuanensis TaxID=1196353 RepID=UPI003D725D91
MARLSGSACTMPTDLPGGVATLTWGSTTLVLAEASACGTTLVEVDALHGTGRALQAEELVERLLVLRNERKPSQTNRAGLPGRRPGREPETRSPSQQPARRRNGFG